MVPRIDLSGLLAVSCSALLAGLLARVPLRKFLGTLNAVPRDFVNVVDQIKKKKEEGEQAA